MKVLVSITSYDRKEMLLDLIGQLKGFDIVVWDDNSDFKIDGDRDWETNTFIVILVLILY